ncbi:MAG: DUF1289 domain-containing protein [Roseovarius sp.]|nr:DUF1289 domain-containing protein [Roseovarius sp.]
MSEQNIWNRSEVESPCVRICVIHPEARICTGCNRTMDEIRLWSKMTPEERREIMAALPDRSSMLTKRRGGRSARLARGDAKG